MNIPASLPVSALSATSVPQNLEDDALKIWLDQCYQLKHTVGYLHSSYACKVVNLTSNKTTLYPADPDKNSKAALKKLANKGLLQHLSLSDTELNAAHAVDPVWVLIPATSDEITNLFNNRLIALGRNVGRGADITEKTAWQVWADAGGRCMFAGCGINLANIPLYNAPARIGYLAHIIASDPNGPRGTINDSHRLSNTPENIMLMCDAHHRLIDCFSPTEYPADDLYKMRQAHRDMVQYYLDSLALPRAKAITLHANLAHIPTYFHDSELLGAILATGRAMLPVVTHYIRRTQRDDRGTAEFWVQYLREHELDIRNLVSSYNSLQATQTEELAVFPLHHIATMVLAGRIIGEARAIQVFQYHRDRKTWEWDSNAAPQPAGTFTVQGLSSELASEVLITIELTASLDPESLPESLSTGTSSGQIPWVRITMPHPNWACISHPDDLNQFMRIARQAINHIQDVMRARHVHLIAISPASTLFCFGQMLQAGHHPTFTIYDRANRDVTFGEAFSISGYEVTAKAGSQTVTISIR